MPRYQIRLYKPHDLDLMELVSRHRFCLQKAAYCCLSAFVKGECFLIRIPEQRAEPLPGKKVYARTLRLSKEKEQDREIIRLLERIAPGYRNNFIKNLLRLYLMYPATGQFFSSPQGEAFVTERYRCFRNGIPLADAASFQGPEPNNATGQTPGIPEDTAADSSGNREAAKGIAARMEPERKGPSLREERKSEIRQESTLSAAPDPAQQESGPGEKKAETQPVDASLISPEEPIGTMEGEEDLTDLFSALI